MAEGTEYKKLMKSSKQGGKLTNHMLDWVVGDQSARLQQQKTNISAIKSVMEVSNQPIEPVSTACKQLTSPISVEHDDIFDSSVVNSVCQESRISDITVPSPHENETEEEMKHRKYLRKLAKKRRKEQAKIDTQQHRNTKPVLNSISASPKSNVDRKQNERTISVGVQKSALTTLAQSSTPQKSVVIATNNGNSNRNGGRSMHYTTKSSNQSTKAREETFDLKSNKPWRAEIQSVVATSPLLSATTHEKTCQVFSKPIVADFAIAHANVEENIAERTIPSSVSEAVSMVEDHVPQPQGACIRFIFRLFDTLLSFAPSSVLECISTFFVLLTNIYSTLVVMSGGVDIIQHRKHPNSYSRIAVIIFALMIAFFCVTYVFLLHAYLNFPRCPLRQNTNALESETVFTEDSSQTPCFYPSSTWQSAEKVDKQFEQKDSKSHTNFVDDYGNHGYW